MQVPSTSYSICIAIDIRPRTAAPCLHRQDRREHLQRDPKQGPSAAMRSCRGAVAERNEETKTRRVLSGASRVSGGRLATWRAVADPATAADWLRSSIPLAL